MNIHHTPVRGLSNEWYTPPEILNALGPFDDDPALPGRIDGLIRPWNGFVWLNPPYGREIKDWLRRMTDHPGGGIALTFARTETRWFRSYIWEQASSLRFLYGRPHFYLNGVRAKGNSGGPVVLIGYGPEADHRLMRCQLPGAFLTGWTAK